MFCLAVFLSFLVLYGVPGPVPGPKAAPGRRASDEAVAGNRAKNAGVGRRRRVPGFCRERDGSRNDRAPIVPQGGAAPVLSEDAERTITIDTASVTAVFSNRGARILSWQLKHYKDEYGKPVDLVPAGLPGTAAAVQPAGRGPGVTARLNGGLYKASARRHCRARSHRRDIARRSRVRVPGCGRPSCARRCSDSSRRVTS